MDLPLTTLLDDLTSRGISLRVEDDRLRYTAPAGSLSSELLAMLKAHKQELIEHLRDRPSTYPASFGQRRFWTLQRLNPDVPFYNAPYAFELAGALDHVLLRDALNRCVKRHESLRTTLREVDGAVQQVVAPTGEISLTVADCPTELVRERLREDFRRPFDLENRPGLRVLLLRTASNRHVLQFCFHNTLYDYSSLMVILEELSAHYAAAVEGGEADLPAATQYREYVRWQESLGETRMEERRAYWRDWFATEPPSWNWIPTGTVSAGSPFDAHLTTQSWTADETRGLRNFSRLHGATPFISLIAVYALTLRRFTNCSDLVLGTTYSNRHDSRFEWLIGPSIDVPTLRVDLSDDPDLPALLTRVRKMVSDALSYQDVPMDRVLPDRKGPLFGNVLSYFPGGRDTGGLRLPGIAVTPLEFMNDCSRPDLYLILSEIGSDQGELLRACWLHKKDVFAAETVGEMTEEFRRQVARAYSR